MDSFKNMNEKKTIFIKDLAVNKTIQLEVLLSMTVSDLKRVIERSFNLENGYLTVCIPRFINKGEKVGITLNDDNSTLFDNNVKNLGTITFSKLKNKGGGGFPMNFTDVSQGKTKDIGFSPKAPSYRFVGKGINIFGICKCKNCQAQGEEVVYRVNKKKIDLIEEKFNITCPECSSIIEPKTVGFWLCKYHIYGEKIENKRIVDFNCGYQEAKDKEHVKYYDEFSNGVAQFSQLIFEVIEYY